PAGPPPTQPTTHTPIEGAQMRQLTDPGLTNASPYQLRQAERFHAPASFGGFATGTPRRLIVLDGAVAVSRCRGIAAALGLLGCVPMRAGGPLVCVSGPLMRLYGIPLRLLGRIDGAEGALGRLVCLVLACLSELRCPPSSSPPSLAGLLGSSRRRFPG